MRTAWVYLKAIGRAASSVLVTLAIPTAALSLWLLETLVRSSAWAGIGTAWRSWVGVAKGCPCERASNPDRDEPRRGEPRALELDDVDDFLYAADTRTKKAPARETKTTVEGLLLSLRNRHPGRMGRLNRDLAWLRKKAARHGITPEDLRWFL